MRRSYILSISTSCHESWDEMASTKQSKFCQSCQKTVTDFSGMSDKEIVSFLDANRGNICGSFRKGQLNREISIAANTRRRPLISVAAIVASLTVAIPSVQAQSKAPKTQMVPGKSDSALAQKRSAIISRVTGTIVDQAGDAIAYASIQLDTLRIGTVTDTSGKFELKIPPDYTEETIRLVMSYIGFYKHEVFLPRTSADYITNDPIVCISMEPRIMGEIRRAPLWYRLRHKVKRLFY